jgi:hypothetical protein
LRTHPAALSFFLSFVLFRGRLCGDIGEEWYTEDDIYVHAARAVCQHAAVACIILYYGA